MTDAPARRTARIDIVHTGCLEPGVTSTCTLVRDGQLAIVVDPGMVERPGDLLEPLAKLGLAPADVTDVVLSHHHPDHCLNAASSPMRGSTTTGRYTGVPNGTRWTRREGS
jgi:glyoxylase-like metal-dependent hydrolase (beta-lactamase superfamily II)